MTAPTILSPAALAGVRVLAAGADTAARQAVADAVVAHGGVLAPGAPEAADQVVVGVRRNGELASGAAAAELTDAFVAARDVLDALPAGGGVLFVVDAGSEPQAGAVRGLCRSLAREAATRGVRVNAVLRVPGANLTDLTDLVVLLLSPAALMCTGAVLEAA
jgi:hypothetical protein